MAPLQALDVRESPQVALRVLNHWDNLDRYVERGYAGSSLWDWQTLPQWREPRYTDYARANASLGINGTVLNNVNASALSLSPAYLAKAAALADLFRPYGIRVYLSARFSAPIELGGWQRLIRWIRLCGAGGATRSMRSMRAFRILAVSWSRRIRRGNPARRITVVPMPTAPTCWPRHWRPNGVVMWRAFVYSHQVPEDRAKQAYSEFVGLDGAFRPNVIVQVKNGPIDFQPREPFHPLFGAMPRTPLMMELQITKEYLGFATHLVYLGTLLRRSAAGRHPCTWRGLHGRPRDRRLVGRSCTDRHRRRCEHWRRPHLERLAFRPGQLVRVRATGMESAAVRARHCRGLGRADLLARPAGDRPDRADDDGLARGGSGLHDAAGPAPPDGTRPSLRSRPLGGRRPACGLDVGLLPPCRPQRHRF